MYLVVTTLSSKLLLEEGQARGDVQKALRCLRGSKSALDSTQKNRNEGKILARYYMAHVQQGPENVPLDPTLEPVKHLSPRLQRRLLRRVHKQRKRFRSSGKPYPLFTVHSRTFSVGKNHWGFTLLLVLAQLD